MGLRKFYILINIEWPAGAMVARQISVRNQTLWRLSVRIRRGSFFWCFWLSYGGRKVLPFQTESHLVQYPFWLFSWLSENISSARIPIVTYLTYLNQRIFSAMYGRVNAKLHLCMWYAVLYNVQTSADFWTCLFLSHLRENVQWGSSDGVFLAYLNF